MNTRTRGRGAYRFAHGDGWVGLLAAILKDTPRLPGCLCRGRWQTFDAPHGGHEDIAQAVAVCKSCPALTACAAWTSTQKDLWGVWAAEFRQPRRYDNREDNDGEAEE